MATSVLFSGYDAAGTPILYAANGTSVVQLTSDDSTIQAGYQPEGITIGTDEYLVIPDATGQSTAIWKWNGSTLTQITSSQNYVSDTVDSNAAATPYPLGSFGGKLFFGQATGLDPDAPVSLAVYDPTTGKVTEPSVPNGGLDPHDFVTFDGNLYFIATDTSKNVKAVYGYDGTTVSEVYVSTAQATVTVNDTPTQVTAAAQVVDGLTVFDGSLFFGGGQTAIEKLTFNASKTSATASLFNTLGSDYYGYYQYSDSAPANLIATTNYLFNANSEDGVDAVDANGTSHNVVPSIGSGSWSPAATLYNGNAVFVSSVYDQSTNGFQTNLYETDGANPATVLVSSFSGSHLVVSGSTLYYDNDTGGLGTVDLTDDHVGTISVPGGTANNPVIGSPVAILPFTAAAFPDGSAPNAPSITGLTAATDSGTPGDGRTDDPTPAITGTGTAGDTISVYLDGGSTALGTTTVQSSGVWTYAFTSALSTGSHSATATDSSGGTASTPSSAYDFTIDPVPSAPGVSGLTAATDTGSSSSDGITRDQTVGAQGAGTNGGIVNVYVDGSTASAGSATVSSDAWSVAALTGSLPPGQHTIRATETDTHGNVSASSSAYTFTIDTTAPAIAIGAVATDDTVNKAEAAQGFAISGTTAGAENGQVVTVQILDASNAVKDGYTAAVSANAWSVPVTPAQATALADGSYTVTANVSDLAGNPAPQATRAVTVDETPPAIAIDAPIAGDNTFNAAEATAGVAISGTTTGAEDGQTVTVTIVDADNNVMATDTGTVTNDAWSVSVPASQHLADGSYTVRADVSDLAGNPAPEATQGIAVDETSPTLGAGTSASASGPDVGVGKAVTFTIATSEPVIVTDGGNGLPTLQLNDGEVATYSGRTGTPVTGLTFSTTVKTGDDVADLEATAFNALPAGTTIRDGAGNDAVTGGFTPIDTGTMVDTVAPAVSSPSLTVAQNSAATPIGIAAPTDAGSATLAIIAGTLPSDGTVKRADGTTVAAGQALTTADLTGLTFTPTQGAYSQSSAFTYTATDGAGNSRTGTATLGVGGPGSPTITGTVAGQTTNSEAAVRPFSSAIVSDPNGGTTDSLAITLSGKRGVLQDGSGQSGLTRTGADTYSLAASTPDAVTAELQALVFVPAVGGSNTRTTTGFALTDTSSAGTTSRTDATTTVTNTDRRTGTVVDGYLAGTTIFEDDNGNGVLDAGEASTTTASDGSFDLSYSPSPLVATGGTDTSTGVANTATLKAPGGATVVTPLTTLVSAVAAQNGGDVAAAQASVLSAFGLPAGTDLLALDPVAAAASGTTGGSAAYVASAQAQDTVALLSAAGSATGYAAIASAIARSSGTVDLTSSATLASIGSAAGLSGSTLGRTVALAQASNSALATAAAATASPTDLLAAVASSQKVAQGTVASALATAVSTGDTSALQRIVSAYAPGNFTGELAFDPFVSYGAGAFTLTGTTQLLTAAGVEVFAQVDGVATDLGAATLNGDGTFTFSDAIGAHTQGFITAVETDVGGGTASGQAGYSLQGGLGVSGRAGQQVRYTDDGSAVIATATFQPNGSRHVDVETSGQTFHSSFFDTFANHGAPQTTFVFDPGHGLDVINQFRANGSDHDTINLPASDFTSLATVFRNTRTVAGGVLISDPVSGDTIKLAGVTKKELTADKADFAFHA